MAGLDWIVQCFTSPLTQYRLYGRRFCRSKDLTNSIKELKEMLQRTNQTTKTTKYTYAQTIIETKKDIHKISPLVYTNMGWLGDSSHRKQVRQAWTAVGLPPRYPFNGRKVSHHEHLPQVSFSSGKSSPICILEKWKAGLLTRRPAVAINVECYKPQQVTPRTMTMYKPNYYRQHTIDGIVMARAMFTAQC